MKGKDKCFCTKCKKFVKYNVSDCILEGKVKEKTYGSIGVSIYE